MADEPVSPSYYGPYSSRELAEIASRDLTLPTRSRPSRRVPQLPLALPTLPTYVAPTLPMMPMDFSEYLVNLPTESSMFTGTASTLDLPLIPLSQLPSESGPGYGYQMPTLPSSAYQSEWQTQLPTLPAPGFQRTQVPQVPTLPKSTYQKTQVPQVPTLPSSVYQRTQVPGSGYQQPTLPSYQTSQLSTEEYTGLQVPLPSLPTTRSRGRGASTRPTLSRGPMMTKKQTVQILKRGRIEEIAALLEGHDVSDLLILAIKKAPTEVVAFLLDIKADPNYLGGKPLLMAIKKLRPDVIQLLSNYGAEPTEAVADILEDIRKVQDIFELEL